MSKTVKEHILQWLPRKYHEHTRVHELVEAVGELFEEIHTEVTSYPDYLNIDQISSDYFTRLEDLFNVPDDFRVLSQEQRKFFITRIAGLIQLNGLDASINFISGLIGLHITYKVLWADDSYSTFSEAVISDGFKSSHINVDINFNYGGVIYTQAILDFVDYFQHFKGIDIVVENVFATVFVETNIPRVGSLSYGGVSARVYPIAPVLLETLAEVPGFLSVTMIGCDISVFPGEPVFVELDEGDRRTTLGLLEDKVAVITYNRTVKGL